MTLAWGQLARWRCSSSQILSLPIRKSSPSIQFGPRHSAKVQHLQRNVTLSHSAITGYSQQSNGSELPCRFTKSLQIQEDQYLHIVARSRGSLSTNYHHPASHNSCCMLQHPTIPISKIRNHIFRRPKKYDTDCYIMHYLFE